jgi:hypothetical protein
MAKISPEARLRRPLVNTPLAALSRRAARIAMMAITVRISAKVNDLNCLLFRSAWLNAVVSGIKT